jgi:Ser-tRNA(Ala) deacylase AlaX
MTEKLYLQDSYLQECSSKVDSVQNDGETPVVTLDRTVFYPTGGGQPNDLGELIHKGKAYQVVGVRKDGPQVQHIVSGPVQLSAGEQVECKIDWARRYAFMRMHTAMHVLGSVMHEKGWLLSGNQIGDLQSRVDFTMESFDRGVFDSVIQKANSLLASNAQVTTSEMPREQALKTEGMVKLAGALPPDIPILRIVDIAGIDTQADGGTHVHNTREVGGIKIDKLDNKGARNKRLYFSLVPPDIT